MMKEEMDRARARAQARLEGDFEPAIGIPSQAAKPEERSAHALEYIAYQLMLIRKALEQKG